MTPASRVPPPKGIHFIEYVLFPLVILLLVIGTFQRNSFWKDEIVLWKDCAGKSPGKARVHVNLGFAYINGGDYDKGAEASQKAIEIDPGAAYGYYNLSIIAQKRGDLDRAIALAKKSLEADATLHMAIHTLGGIYFEKGLYQESVAAYRKFLEIYPYFPEVHNILAIVYAAQRQFDQAVTEFEQEIRINPYHILAHVNLGQIYWHEFRNRQKAVYHLKAALTLDPFLPQRREIRSLVRQLEGAT